MLQQASRPHFMVWEAIEIGVDLAKGLEFMHGMNLMHCSFRPDNIVFKEKWFDLQRLAYVPRSAKFIDFGNCKKLEQLNQAVAAPATARQGYSAGLLLMN